MKAPIVPPRGSMNAMTLSRDHVGPVAAAGVLERRRPARCHVQHRQSGGVAIGSGVHQLLAVGRPAERVDDGGGHDQPWRATVRAHHPDAAASTAIGDERDLAPVWRNRRPLVECLARRYRRRCGGTACGPQVPVAGSRRAEDQPFSIRRQPGIEIARVSVGHRFQLCRLVEVDGHALQRLPRIKHGPNQHAAVIRIAPDACIHRLRTSIACRGR